MPSSNTWHNFAEPEDALIFAEMTRGELWYIPPANTRDDNRGFIGRSPRPVAITYDPVFKVCYWLLRGARGKEGSRGEVILKTLSCTYPTIKLDRKSVV